MPESASDRAVFDTIKALIAATQPDADAEAAADLLTSRQGRASRAFELAAEDISQLTGLGNAAANAIDMIDELSRYAGVEKMGAQPLLISLDQAGTYFRALCRGRHIEYCYAACLDARKRLINCRLVGKGTLNAAQVYIRSILQNALRSGASYVYLAHNHPGGGLTPSKEDITLTRAASQALRMIGVSLLDHIIVTDNAFAGIVEGGWV